MLKAGEVGHKHRNRYRSEIDFGELVRECIELAQYAAPPGGRGDELRSAAQRRTAVKVHGDAEDLRTAVSNLLDNAIKYSGEKVDVTVQLEAPDEKRVKLNIRDRGVGIPPDELKRIFKRFYRVPGRALRK